jgi:hypothetical protein
MELRHQLAILGSSLALVLSTAGTSAMASSTSCPSNFQLKPSTACSCSSNQMISCSTGGELMYRGSMGVEVNGTTLQASNGVSVKCDGSMWGVKAVHRHVGFKCMK